MLLAQNAPRPSEIAALPFDPFGRGGDPGLLTRYRRSAGVAAKQHIEAVTGRPALSGFYVSEHPKQSVPGDEGRLVPVVDEIRDFCDRHYAAGCPNRDFFATSPEGKSLRWNNILHEYLLPASGRYWAPIPSSS